jgi:tRNA(Ile2) C34 agmatinyltransferase TiaS
MIEMIIRTGSAPICPRCDNGNAMLDKDQAYLQCRDCGYEIHKSKCVLVYTELDKPGMGMNSTYTEVGRRPADYHLPESMRERK